MGKSTGSSTQQVQLTPEQQQTLALQNQFMQGTLFPAYQQTVGGASNAMNSVLPAATSAAQNATNVAQQTGAVQQAAGTLGTMQGMQGLSSLFNPNYEQNQINAALQAGRESARESQAGQNAMYGGSGQLGSSRMALADANLSSLNAQRQATAAAGAQAQVQQNKMQAAQSLLGAGQAGLTGAQQAAANQIGFAQTPQDIYSKYASVVFGVPQGNTTPNYAGTQSSTSSGSSKGFRL